jgi:uncharacterized protein (DUF952 family)
MPEPIFHVATAADWEAAVREGAYTTSTRGRTLAEEGYIHASRREQVPLVLERWYADVDEPLVLLVIDPDRLAAEVRVEPVGHDTYPHVHGPIAPTAVVEVQPIRRRSSSRPSSSP